MEVVLPSHKTILSGVVHKFLVRNTIHTAYITYYLRQEIKEYLLKEETAGTNVPYGVVFAINLRY